MTARQRLGAWRRTLVRTTRPGGLRAADECWARGAGKQAAARLADGLEAAFARTLHFDGLGSPLAADPAGYLGALRASSSFAALQRPRGRQRPAAPDRPSRLLAVSFKNWNFLGRVLERYETAGLERVTRLDLADLLPPPPLSVPRLTEERLLGPADARSREWAAPLAAAMDDADVVWVEWGQRAAVVVSLLDPGAARVIVRVHSHEVFTAFPQLVDWSRVDDVVFVGAQVRALAEAVAPALSAGPRLHVLPNAVDFAPYSVEKDDGARHVLGLIGWSAVAKDPIWALEVLGRLRQYDSRYRLLLVGRPLDRTLSPTAARYADDFAARSAQADVAGAVVQLGQVDDVGGALRGIGVVLSASLRESFHQGLVEGAASGAVPVVRDWPVYAAYGGARAVFDDDWVVDGVDAAVDRVLATTADEDSWDRVRMAAASRAREQFDWPVVAPRYDELLGLSTREPV
jgi:glycosyltransferase involved in cell wall biosynthesis